MVKHPPSSLTEYQLAIIDLFVNLAQSFGLQKSIGQIYGLLYASPEPLCLDALVVQLGISKGSGSQGLRTLRALGAVNLVFVPGDRRDHYAPEIRLKKLVAGILQNNVTTGLANGRDRIAHIEHLFADAHPDTPIPADPKKRRLSPFSKNPASSLNPSAELPTALIAGRIQKLKTWHQKTANLIPIIQKLTND